MESEKPLDAQRRATIIETAQNPQKFLLQNFKKGSTAAIDFLFKVRQEIKNDATYKISQPDKNFKDFYVSNNAEQPFYDSLVIMLKNAGHTKIDVASALFDHLPSSQTAGSRTEAIKKYIQMTELAVNNVYGTD